MLLTSSRLAVIAASCLAMTLAQAVELFHVTTHVGDEETSNTKELKFSICLNEDVINVVADEFIDYAQTISPEFSVLADQVTSLKHLVCNDHTKETHSNVCEREKPSRFLDPASPFSSISLGDEAFRISVREGQSAADLTDCFCSKHICSYHQGKYIEDALTTKIKNAPAAQASASSKKNDINIKTSDLSPGSKSKKSKMKKKN